VSGKLPVDNAHNMFYFRWFPECSFLLQQKGEDYVTDVRNRTPANKKVTSIVRWLNSLSFLSTLLQVNWLHVITCYFSVFTTWNQGLREFIAHGLVYSSNK